MKYYIYVHKDPRNNQIKYVGKGTKYRFKNLIDRSGAHLVWINSLLKLNLKPVCEIVERFDNEKDAYSKEIELIKHYKDLGIKLKNGTNGGEGGIGLRGELNPNFGIKETAAAKANRKKIVCLNYGTIFNSITEAAEKFNLCTSKISAVCSLRRRQTGGLEFRYLGEEHLIFKRKKRTLKNRHMPKHRKPVMLVELNITFDKIMDAVRYCKEKGLRTDRSGIRGSASGKNKTAAGYTWRFI